MARKALEQFAEELVDLSNRAAQAFMIARDWRLRKTHFLLEELAEVTKGLAFRSEIVALTGLADLAYAVTRTAVAFDLPLTDGFEAVHAANMTVATEGNGSVGRVVDTKDVLMRYRASQQEAKARAAEGTGL